MQLRDDFDPQGPQKEAAMFYGLFLRGHSAESLRRDIDVPQELLDKYLKNHSYQEDLRRALCRTYNYRKQVLRIFDQLVLNEKTRGRLQ
jgi:hypothetical protein